MKLTNPKPRLKNGQVDFDLTTPNTAADFPCRGAQKAGDSSSTVAAGSSLQVTIEGGAPHGGGHCMFSLSQDGQKWLVVNSIAERCLTGATSGPFNFNVPIPAGTPAGNYVFSWGWIPKLSGQPEFYHNCADITVTGGGSGISGPEMLVANLDRAKGPVIFESTFNQFQSTLDAQPSITLGAKGSAPVNPNPSKGAPAQPPKNQTAPANPPKSESPKKTPPQTPNPGRGVQDPPTNTSPGLLNPNPSPSGVPILDGPVNPPPQKQPEAPAGACTNGEMKCSGQSKFMMCSNGEFVTMDMAPGTVCEEENGSIRVAAA